MLRMARVEVSSRTALEAALSSSSVEAPMCVFAWQCLDVLCHIKHGTVEKIVSEVPVCVCVCVCVCSYNYCVLC